MNGCSLLAMAALALGACGDESPGTRGDCASGGTLTECSDPVLTPEQACDKLVACGVIPRDSHNNGDDWGSCINDIYRTEASGAADFTIGCIDATSCDELRSGYCFALGGN